MSMICEPATLDQQSKMNFQIMGHGDATEVRTLFMH